MLLTCDDNLKCAPRGLCVYVIRCHDYYKIGYATDVMGRLGQLQVGCPYPLKLAQVYYTADAALLEAELHERYADYRTQGEWFQLPDSWRGVTCIEWPPRIDRKALDAYTKKSGYWPLEGFGGGRV